MPPQMLGVALVLSWFIVAIALLELIAIGVRRVVRSDVHPNTVFALGIAPLIGALVFVAGIVIPAQSKFELPQAAESINVTVVTLFLAAVSMLVTTIVRGRRAVRLTRRLIRRWMRQAKPLPTATAVRAFVIEDSFPHAVLVGVISPRILVARCVLDQLTAWEFDAVIAHELAHHAGRDNFKRLLLACSPVIWSRSEAARWTQHWSQASDRAADAAAAAGDPNIATALASALIKTSRLITQADAAGSLCYSALDDGAPVADRVRQLLGVKAPERTASVALRCGLAGAFLGGLAVYPSVLPLVHRATEWLLHGLP